MVFGLTKMIILFILGKNGDIVYSLSSEEYFTLEQYTDDSGEHLDLIPAGNLDHEKTASMIVQMIASNPVSDDDLTVQSSRVNLAITVLDKNEFKPSFDKEVWLKINCFLMLAYLKTSTLTYL